RYSVETFTLTIRSLLVCQQEMLQRLLSTHSTMVQEMQNSDRLLAEHLQTAENFVFDFYEAALQLTSLSSMLNEVLGEASSSAWMDERSTLEQIVKALHE